MKKLLCIFVLCLLLVCSAFADNTGVKVFLDGTEIIFDVEPQIINGRTMVPVRAIFEAMGATVIWDNDTNTAFCSKDTKLVSITVDDYNMYINSAVITMDAAPVIIDSRVLAPARFVAEAFDATVYWDGEKSHVYISTVPANAIVTVYAIDGRTIDVYGSQMQEYLNVGWFRTKEETVQTLYTPDGREIIVYKSEVPLYLGMGWYQSAFEARCVNIPKGQTIPSSPENCVYITPSGKKYHIDPNCGGKNSYPVYYAEAIKKRTPCSKCAM